MTKEEYIQKYGEVEGTRRWKHSECRKRYQEKHRKERLEYLKEYARKHRDEKRAYDKQYHQEHREARLVLYRQYHQEHKKERLEYRRSPYGRAIYLVGNYRLLDRKYHRGECTLTAKWIVDKIFTRSCIYCGESDWRLLGCDRIHNNLPHTVENVVCCCGECNKKRNAKDFLDFAYSIGAKDSEGLIIRA